MYPVQVSSEVNQVPTLRQRCHVSELVVAFSPLFVSVVRAAKIDETSNNDFRPDLVAGSQCSSAGAHLESDAIEGTVGENRSKRARYSLVFDEAAAPSTRIDQTSCIEGVSCLAIVRQCILEQQGVLAPDLVVQSPREFGFCTCDSK